MDIKISEFPVYSGTIDNSSLYPIIVNGSNYTMPISSMYKQISNYSDNIANVVSISGSSHTLALSSVGAFIRKTNTTAHSIIVPKYASVPWIGGSIITIRNVGSSNLQITPDTGVTFYHMVGRDTVGTYETVQLLNVEPDKWDLV